MNRPRALLFPASVLALACVSGLSLACASGKKGPDATETPADAAPSVAPPAATAKPTAPPAKPVELTKVDIQLENLEDIFVAADKIAQSWADTAPSTSSKETVTNLLMAGGFKPTFAESFDWTGRWDVHAEVPSSGDDSTFVKHTILHGALPAVSASAIVSSLPSSLKVTTIGENLFQATPEGENELSLVLQPAAKHLLFGRGAPDLAQALALTSRGSQSGGKRFSVSASGLPKSALAELNNEGAYAEQLKAILAATTTQLAFDLGSDRDASYTLTATGNFEQFTHGLVGAPLTQVSSVASKLPGHAVASLVIPWGSPKYALDMLKKQLAGIPAPFDTLAAETVAHLEVLSSQIADEVVLAFYVDKKGKLAVIAAASVKDDASATASVDAMWGDINKAKDLVFAATGDDKSASESKYQAKVKFGKSTGRTLSIALSSDLSQQLSRDSETSAFFAMALDTKGKKSSLAMHSLVHDQVAYFAVGAAGKGILAQVAGGKLAKDNLETDGGLADARALTGGCQLCVTVDTRASLDVALRFASADAANPKLAKELAKKLAKLKFDYDLAGGLRLGADQFVATTGVPKELLFMDRNAAQDVLEVLNGLEHLDEAPEPTVKAKSSKKGS